MATNNPDNSDKAKPQGDPDDTAQPTPDVKHEGWSAEEISEESAYDEGTEVKEQMKQGRRIERRNEQL
jgi:hypothetical protein